MSLGKFDHFAKFCTEGLTCGEFDDVNGETALAVDADLRPFNGGVVGMASAGSVVGIGHFVAPRSVFFSEPYIPQLRSEGKDPMDPIRWGTIDVKKAAVNGREDGPGWSGGLISRQTER